MENNKYILPLAIVVAGVLVAGAIYLGGGNKSANLPNKPGAVSQEEPQIELAPVTERDHVLGDANAPVVIIEYSDLECPFCKIFHSTMQEVVTTYEGQVAWVYRHFPIPELHTKAIKESEATECAWDQGGNDAFWRFTNELFERTGSNDSLDLAELPKIAEDTGLIVDSFSTCLSSGRFTEYVESSALEAVRAGARGTPYSIAITKDGRRAIINGAEPLNMIRAKIDTLLELQ